tara:strand:+ start:54 stop:557 length:504 start_codon:yes stop_codon:yes gene_type:complete
MKFYLTLLLICATTWLQAQPDSVGFSVYGDFNGDGIKEYAFSVQTQAGIGTPDLYAIYFSDGQIPEIEVGCCEVVLVNEGDLNGDGADDISLFQAPMNGNTYSMTTVSLTDTTWETIVPSFFIPTAGYPLSVTDLQNRVYVKQGVMYYLVTDVNDEEMNQIEREVRL